MTETKTALGDLYLEDEVAWLSEMSQLIRAEKFDELDYANLVEWLEAMKKRELREVKSRLRVLLAHVLKWNFQPDKQTPSWENTIVEQLRQLKETFEDSRTLANFGEEILETVYSQSVRDAVRETGLDRSAFPAACPYTIDSLLADVD